MNDCFCSSLLLLFLVLMLFCALSFLREYIRYMKAAAAQEYYVAEYRLGQFYEHGLHGLTRDLSEALKLYLKVQFFLFSCISLFPWPSTILVHLFYSQARLHCKTPLYITTLIEPMFADSKTLFPLYNLFFCSTFHSRSTGFSSLCSFFSRSFFCFHDIALFS